MHRITDLFNKLLQKKHDITLTCETSIQCVTLQNVPNCSLWKNVNFNNEAFSNFYFKDTSYLLFPYNATTDKTRRVTSWDAAVGISESPSHVLCAQRLQTWTQLSVSAYTRLWFWLLCCPTVGGVREDSESTLSRGNLTEARRQTNARPAKCETFKLSWRG